MSTTHTVAGYAAPSRLAAALSALAAEASALGEALLNPGKLVAEVEQIRSLQVEANRVEARNPARAEALRRRASRICLD
ncbi:MAG TPA: hypothetical protein VIW70_11725 [Rubrivivax sp.]